ncbi:MAG: hypothetical protein J2P43_03220 [Candidatus Dormibacteraeota bacterium]|nr:hypothetical protein [Candidatus Dormibacteraeota bacterium]
MSADPVTAVARAVLYEGYLLYPYTRSATKNQVRWTFGGIYPKGTPGERSTVQTECLLRAGPGAVVRVAPRCLQLVRREKVGEASWQEAMERQLADAAVTVGKPAGSPLEIPIELPAGSADEPATHRAWEQIEGRLSVAAEELEPGLFRIRARVENLTPPGRDPQMRAFCSTHIVLQAPGGGWVSLTDPPAALREAAAACRQEGLWPVLAGEPGSTETMLASPIILQDYPRVAEESPGDLFDATEIDEILSLRILTLSDAEKAELRRTDPRAAAVLDRTEQLTPEQFLRLHGTLRDPGPPPACDPSGLDVWGEPEPLGSVAWQHGTLRVGDRVRLRPPRAADAMDLMLTGRVGRVESIVQELEGRVQVAVLLDDDPGADLGEQRLPGHRFFYQLHEVEPA